MKNSVIPIFDSLTHPTLDGDWILPKYPHCARIDDLIQQMKDNNIKGSFAVGMKGIGGYEEDKYVDFIKQKGNSILFPIAFFDFTGIEKDEDITSKMISIKAKGYCGIKLHPRIGNFELDHLFLPFAIDKANELGLVVLLCTYFYSNKQSISINNIERLSDLLLHIDKNSRVVLLHGGGVRILETMEIVRAFPNTLLDISLTLCKYAGSSLDLDIAFLFKQFDRRVCVGSDHPEISLAQMRNRFDYFASMTTKEKAENIAYKNIEKLLI